MARIAWILLAGSAALWAVVLGRLRYLERAFPPLDSTTACSVPPGGWPFVSLIVPARNEEKDLPDALGSMLGLDYPGCEIVLVDDRSDDATARIASDLGAGRSFFHCIRGRPRPNEKWIGKPWALVQGVEASRGEWLLFADADVVLHPLALKQAMSCALQNGVSALSLLPAIACRTFREKMTMPLFALLSALVHPMDAASRPGCSASRLSGAFILARRKDYEAVGGHRAVAGDLIEDMALARAFRRSAFRIRLTWTHDLASTRMYDSWSALWAGLTRLSYPMMKYAPAGLAAAWLAALVGPLAPWLVLLEGLARGAAGERMGWALAIGGMALCAWIPYILRDILILLRVPRRYAWLLPVAALIYCLAATASAVRHHTGRGLTWKNRRYVRPPASSGGA